MRNSDTGEFELVVGNRQLLSGFFIMILLLAVTFAMGYVVGQNSPRSAKTQADAGPAPGGGAADSRPVPSQALPPAALAATSAPIQPAADAAGPPAGDASAATSPPPSAATAAPPAAAAAAPAPAPGEPVTELPPGSYWQVMAVRQGDAEIVVHTLKDMGMPALMSPAPNRPNLMRVLVGPYNDTESMSRAKSQLENAGFQPIKK